MSISTFIPTLWSARLLENLQNAQIATAFVNRDYEGEIKKKGDKVKVNSIGAITINKYTKSDIASAEELTTTGQDLVVNQADYYNFQVDDIDRVQAAGTIMDGAMREASYGLADVADKYVFDTIAKGVATGNKITGESNAPISLTSSNAYENIVKMKTMLDKNNVPSQGRKLAVPPEMEGLLLMDQRFVGTGGSMAEGNLQNGFIGKVAGFDVYVSNNLPVDSTSQGVSMIATHTIATSYANQITETEAYRPESRFSDAMKGLHVYGAKVFRSTAVVVLLGKFA